MTTLSMLWDIFWIFLKLGCTSFGGPIAHIGFFRSEFVQKQRWLSERDYFDLVALCQFLPGPASSQVGMALGLLRAGYAGAFVAWLGFTLPSALVMIALGVGFNAYPELLGKEIGHGLKIIALAIIAHAVFAMAKTFCNTASKIAITLLSLAFLQLTLMQHSGAGYWQILAISIGALSGMLLVPKAESDATTAAESQHQPVPWLNAKAGIGWGLVFLVLLIGLPIVANLLNLPVAHLVDDLFRAGSLVFGGGHAVLPQLQAEFVEPGLLSADSFVAGYGAVQAMPGPLFSFAGYLGASISEHSGMLSNGWGLGIVAICAIFAPAFLLLAAVLPFWLKFRNNGLIQRAMAGIGASVVGILLSTLYHPVWTSTIYSPLDFGLALTAFALLQFGKISPLVLVLIAVSISLTVRLLF
ncbi:MAG: chromate efflux transporter [Gammaproteobacteria bacterium]|nr:chromate efflux transporter [Gammaproteobacteria bacterium]